MLTKFKKYTTQNKPYWFILVSIVTFLSYPSYNCLSQDYEIMSFSTTIDVQEDGEMHITEKIKVNFYKKRRGIIRSIPYNYFFEENQYLIKPYDIEVTTFNSKISQSKPYINIRIGEPKVYLTGNQLYTIRYKIQSIILQHDDYQQLYWNVTGNKWDTAIKEASITIKLPKDYGVTKNDIRIWKGNSLDKKYTTNYDFPNTRTINSKVVDLESGQGMTMAIKFPKAFFDLKDLAIYSTATNTNRKSNQQNPLWLTIPLLIFILFFSYWKKLRNKKYDLIDITKLQFYPPDGITSAHVGTFIDFEANLRDVMSLIPYWAAEDLLIIKFDGKDTFLHKKKSIPPHFPEYERHFFDAIFRDRHDVNLSLINGKLTSEINQTRRSLKNEIVYQDYYDDEYLSFWRSKKIIFIIILSVIIAVLAFIKDWMFLGIGFCVLSFGLLILATFKPVLSKKGQKNMVAIKAFKKFINNPNKSDLENIFLRDKNYFDKIFPFSVAFGIDKSWLKSISTYQTNSPLWYESTEGNDIVKFSKTYNTKQILNNMIHDHSQVVSTGGGFNRGGSSGGGFGGGGGSSW